MAAKRRKAPAVVTPAETMEHQNKVILCGNIVYINMTRNYTTMGLAVNANGIQAYPTITIYDPALLDGIRVRDNVRVEAHMQVHVDRQEGRKPVYQNIIAADKIERRLRALHYYLDIPETDSTNGAMPDDENEVFIVGRVDHLFIPDKENRNLVIVSARMDIGGRTYGTEISCFQRQASRVIRAEKGDVVVLCGTIRTSMKEEDRGRDVQNVSCRDIVLLPAAKHEEEKPADTDEAAASEEQAQDMADDAAAVDGTAEPAQEDPAVEEQVSEEAFEEMENAGPDTDAEDEITAEPEETFEDPETETEDAPEEETEEQPRKNEGILGLFL